MASYKTDRSTQTVAEIRAGIRSRDDLRFWFYAFHITENGTKGLKNKKQVINIKRAVRQALREM